MKFEVLLPCVFVYLYVSVLPKAIFLPSFTVVVHKCHFLVLVGVFIVQNGKTRCLLRNEEQIAPQVIKLKTRANTKLAFCEIAYCCNNVFTVLYGVQVVESIAGSNQ